MKKRIARCFAATLLTLAAAMPLLADTWTDPDTGYTWTYHSAGRTATIFSSGSVAAISPEPTGTLTIPATLGGKPVTKIGFYAFYNCSGLTNVVIPDSVTIISGSAFSGCSGLTSVVIPAGVRSIGPSAFFGCNELTSVIIPDSVADVGSDAFCGCSDLLFDTSTIPGVKLVDGWAVGYTDGLSGALDLTGIRGIGASAFLVVVVCRA